MPARLCCFLRPHLSSFTPDKLLQHHAVATLSCTGWCRLSRVQMLCAARLGAETYRV